jgi:single-strand DNA-binding protein
MSNDLNHCEFIGRLGRDPESRFTPSGDQIVNFSLAVGWKTKDKEGVEWISVVAFGKLAEICAEYLNKGKQIYVSGRWNTQKWQDKETGQDRYSTRLIADQMQMLGSKDDTQEPARHHEDRKRPGPQMSNNYANESQHGSAAPRRPQAAGSLADMDDDIPFMRLGHGASWRCM